MKKPFGFWSHVGAFSRQLTRKADFSNMRLILKIALAKEPSEIRYWDRRGTGSQTRPGLLNINREVCHEVV